MFRKNGNKMPWVSTTAPLRNGKWFVVFGVIAVARPLLVVVVCQIRSCSFPKHVGRLLETCDTCAFVSLAAGFNHSIITLDFHWMTDVIDANLTHIRPSLTWSASPNGPMASHFLFEGRSFVVLTRHNGIQGCQEEKGRRRCKCKPSLLLCMYYGTQSIVEMSVCMKTNRYQESSIIAQTAQGTSTCDTALWDLATDGCTTTYR